MKRKMIRLLLLSVFLSAIAVCRVHAQTEPVRSEGLDHEKWESLTEGMEFPLPQIPEEEEVQVGDTSSGNREPFVKVLIIAVAIGLIAFILYQLLSGDSLFGPKNRKFSKSLQIDLENIEEHLPEADIPDFIRDALRKGDFKLAVRLHYLGLIQALARRQWIEWKRDKTNGDYLQEVQSQPVFDGFREVTLIFEKIWYGNRNLAEDGYRQIAGRFAEVEAEIKRS